ncbi:MAG: two component transcriptional regulator, AraC family protein [Paenibacillus sp.]|jgi:two-component system response regulator YesN|nr:two component transcriptional regulator, AraC family protein [Paenibacillus sp.]
MNLLIVEDELRLCNSLANNFAWETYGIEVIGMAHNGLQAIELLERRKPDIVILDIQMPGMDGLTLARHIQEQSPLTKMIILSGHDNFTYAQTALELGVVKYLLKPAGDEEILQSVLESASQLREELERRHDQAELQQKWIQHLPHLQNNFFLNWVSGKYEEWEVLERSQDVQVGLAPTSRYALAVVDMDPLPEQETRFTSQDASLLQFSLNSIAREMLQDCLICSDTVGHTIVLFPMPPDKEANSHMLYVNTELSRLLSNVKACLKLTASAGIGGSCVGINEVPMLYSQANIALQSRILYGRDIAIPFRETTGRTPILAVEPTLEKALEIALQTGDEVKALETVELLWKHGMSRADTIEDVHENVMYWSSLLIRTIQKQGWIIRELVGDDYTYMQNHKLLTTKEQIYAWLQRIVRSVIVYVHKQRSTTSHQMVKSILSIVENEMDQEITLHTVADRLYLNSSYLSRLFKQETGQSFSSYVLERKMERAKAALVDGAKISEAASMVGYHDGSYFTRVFRKFWGVTPGEIRSS